MAGKVLTRGRRVYDISSDPRNQGGIPAIRGVLPKRIDKCSLASLQQRLVKTGGRVVNNARYYWLLLAEGHLTRRVRGATVSKDCGAAAGTHREAQSPWQQRIGQQKGQGEDCRKNRLQQGRFRNG